MTDAIIERPIGNGKLRAVLLGLLGLTALGVAFTQDAAARELTPTTVQQEVSLPLADNPLTIDSILKEVGSKPKPPLLTTRERATLPPVPSDAWKARYGKHVKEAALRNNLPPNLIMAVIAVESGFKPNARSGTSSGLMQIKPATARSFGWNPRLNLFDPVTNINVASNYLGAAYKLSKGNVCRAASLYNQGLGARGLNTHYCTKVRNVMRHTAFHIDE